MGGSRNTINKIRERPRSKYAAVGYSLSRFTSPMDLKNTKAPRSTPQVMIVKIASLGNIEPPTIFSNENQMYRPKHMSIFCHQFTPVNLSRMIHVSMGLIVN